ncbi:hypothetical protein [Paenibacillus dendritiformis]|uniref:hypothetical protein n=1 Tax=Paenibacillus dendritiformis TaxID=130049 RepID=UPI00387E10AA
MKKQGWSQPLKKINFIILYILSIIYIFPAFYSIFFKVKLPPVIIAHAGVVAFLITAAEFFFIGYQIFKEKRRVIRKTLCVVIALALLGIAVCSLYYLIKYWRILNKDSLAFAIGLISDYSTVAALGVVFLTKAMRIRTKPVPRVK